MRAVFRFSGLLCLLLVSRNLMAAYQIDLDPGVTSYSQSAFEIHHIVMWICVAIGIVVFGAMFYSILFHRKSRDAVPAKFDDNTKIEILWTVIPAAILIFMAIPATKVLLAMEDTSNSDMSIKVTGYQWKWHYDYLDNDVAFFSNLSTPQEQIKNQAEKGENYLLEVDNRLVIPTNKKVRFLFTASDVIHSWWVPAFGLKKDAIPGYINEGWTKVDQPGVYRGQCAELCGTNHGFMPIVVEAKSEADYLAWVDTKKAEKALSLASADRVWSKSDLMAQGEKVYNANCTACHQATGLGIPNVFPALKNSKIVVGEVSKHIAMVLDGVQGTAMQAFANQLSDADLAALITYERNAWGNDTGDIIQPSDIKLARK